MTPSQQDIYNSYQKTRSIGNVVTFQNLLDSIEFSMDTADDARNVIALLITNGALAETDNVDSYVWL